MKSFNCLFGLAVLFLMQSVAFGQQKSSSPVEIDYNNPHKYVVGGVTVEGNRAFGENRYCNSAVCVKEWKSPSPVMIYRLL